MEQPKSLYLVNLYDGQVQRSFDDADHLVAYLREKNKAGTLNGEGAFAVFWGQQLSTGRFWKSAFDKKEVSTL